MKLFASKMIESDISVQDAGICISCNICTSLALLINTIIRTVLFKISFQSFVECQIET